MWIKWTLDYHEINIEAKELVLIFLSKTELGRQRNHVLRYSTRRLARLTKFDDSSQMQYIDQCVRLYGDETIYLGV